MKEYFSKDTDSREVDVLILGASFFGASLAMSLNVPCQLIEPKDIAGSDFADCAISNRCCMSEASPLTEMFKAELLDRGLLDAEGQVHIYPLAAVLSEFLLKKKIPVLLSTQVISVNQADDGWTVTLFNGDGFSRVTTRYIIDTTPMGISNRLREKEVYEKYISIPLAFGDGEVSFSGDGVFTRKGLFDNEYYLWLNLSKSDNMAHARQKLVSFLTLHGCELNGYRPAAMASSFWYEYKEKPLMRTVKDHWIWIPSCSFGDPLSALEGGVQYAVSHHV